MASDLGVLFIRDCPGGLAGPAKVVLACVDHGSPRLHEEKDEGAVGLRRSRVRVCLRTWESWQARILELAFG